MAAAFGAIDAGVRPTRSSRRERVVEQAALLEVAQQAAMGWSMAFACLRARPCRVLIQLCDELPSTSSTNRTPRSASRRATRHCQPSPLLPPLKA